MCSLNVVDESLGVPSFPSLSAEGDGKTHGLGENCVYRSCLRVC